MRKLLCLFLLLSLAAPVFAQRGHRNDVQGDFFGTDMYLHPVKIVVGTDAPELTLTRDPDNDCLPGTLDVSCFAITDPDTPFDKTLSDVYHFVIPGKTLHDVLLIEGRNFTTVYYRGDAPEPVNAAYLYNPTITIESPALSAPINASLGRTREGRMIQVGESAGHDQQFTRSYRLSRSLMKLGMGFSDDVIDKFFDSDITIHMNLRVRALQVDYIDGLYDFMVYGY